MYLNYESMNQKKILGGGSISHNYTPEHPLSNNRRSVPGSIPM